MWIYRGSTGEAAVRNWCHRRWSSWPPHHRRVLTSSVLGSTHITVAGADHPDTVVLLPGRHANAAVSTPLVTALAERYRVVVVDLPGEAGLSSGGRPNTARLHDYGSWLSEFLPQLADGPVHLLGHASGAAVALAAAPSSHVAGLLLMNPAGLVRPALNPGLLAAGARWRLCPTRRSSRLLLARLWGSGAAAPDELVEWMQVVGRHVRWSSTPPPPPPELVRRWSSVPCIVAAGERAVVFPPDRLAVAARDLLRARLVTVPGAGHLMPYEQPAAVLGLLAEQQLPRCSPLGLVRGVASAACACDARPAPGPAQDPKSTRPATPRSINHDHTIR